MNNIMLGSRIMFIQVCIYTIYAHAALRTDENAGARPDVRMSCVSRRMILAVVFSLLCMCLSLSLCNKDYAHAITLSCRSRERESERSKRARANDIYDFQEN